MRILRESSKWVEKFRSVRSKSEKIVRIALHRNDNSRKNYDNFLRGICKGFLHKRCESIVLVASTRALKWCRVIFKPITLFSRAMGIILGFFSWLHKKNLSRCEWTELSVSAFKFLNECLLKRKPPSFSLPPERITFMSTCWVLIRLIQGIRHRKTPWLCHLCRGRWCKRISKFRLNAQ